MAQSSKQLNNNLKRKRKKVSGLEADVKKEKGVIANLVKSISVAKKREDQAAAKAKAAKAKKSKPKKKGKSKAKKKKKR